MPYAFSIPKMQIRGDAVCIYYEPHYTSCFNHQPFKLRLYDLKQEKKYTGQLTVSTKKRMRKAISLLIQSARSRTIHNTITNKKESFKLNFITLTIPHTETNITLKEGYTKALRPFLQWMNKTMNVCTYIWKAEITKKGQLHYHITTTTWMHYQAIRNKWNYILQKNGMMKSYYDKYHNNNPNSTDVHKVFKIKNIEAYLCKEFTKQIQSNHTSTGKLWDCSTNLKGVNYFTVEFKEQHERLMYGLLEITTLEEWKNDHCTIIKAAKNIALNILPENEQQKYLQFIQDLTREKLLTLN